MNLPPPVPTTRDQTRSVVVAAEQPLAKGEVGNFVVLHGRLEAVRIRAMAHRDLDICEVVEIVEPDLDISKEKG